MGNRIGTSLTSDFNLAFGDQGAGNTGAEQILALINGIGPEHRKNVVTHEFFPEVLNEDFPHTQTFCLRPRRLYFLALTNIRGKRDHLATIRILQPFQDDRGIQTT